MKKLNVIVTPTKGYLFSQYGLLEKAEILRLVPSVRIVQMGQQQLGQYFLNLEFSEADNERLMTALANTFQQLGYSLLEATLIEMASGAIEGLCIGALGGLGLGSKASDSTVTLASSCIGMAIGAWLGQSVKWEKNVYGVRRDSATAWTFTPIRS